MSTSRLMDIGDSPWPSRRNDRPDLAVYSGFLRFCHKCCNDAVLARLLVVDERLENGAEEMLELLGEESGVALDCAEGGGVTPGATRDPRGVRRKGRVTLM